MKKKIISAALAAAVIFTGTGINQAEAAPAKQVTCNTINQEEVQKLIEKYFSYSNTQLPVQLKVNGGQVIVSVQGKEVKVPAADKAIQKPVESKPATNPTNTNKATVNKEEKPAATNNNQTAKPTQPTQPSQNNNNDQAQQETQKPQQEASSVSAFEKKVVELTNAERAKQGLAPLTLDTELSKVARAKSQDMKDRNYFDHNSPTYGSPFDMMKSFGISYKSAGENIAQGQTSPEQVVQAWMNSQGHRENIMNSSFTHIGVGYVQSGNYWTQMFIGK